MAINEETLELESALKKLDKYELLILNDIGYVKKNWQSEWQSKTSIKYR